MKAELSASDTSVAEVHRFYRCEVTLWKDGAVTIASLDEPRSPILTFRRVPNPWCGRD
jgi:hypothetical protein